MSLTCDFLQGTSYVFNFLLRPYVSEHETEIDRKLLEVNVRAKEMGLLLWQEAASYGHTRFSDILHYFSSESALQPQTQVMGSLLAIIKYL